MVVGMLFSCSTKKNTAFTRFKHSFHTRYNIYYNGSLAYIDANLEKEQGNKDNFTEMIPLYTVGNKQSRDIGKANYDRAIEKCEKAIKLHSIKQRPEWNKSRKKTESDIEWLNRKEYNPFIWRAWMMMGRSQFYKGDFDASAATFSYMTRLYRTRPAILAQARAWLAKSYIESDWLYDAEDVLRTMRRDSIPRAAQHDWNSANADYYIHAGQYKEAIPYLRQVIKHEKRRKQKAREYFLLGQLYAAQGQRKEAYSSYRKCISQTPPYDLEFNARIAMTEVMAAGQSRQMISRLRRMARNDNNKEFLDQVYYAIGNIYITQRDTMSAVAAYEKGNEKSTRNGIEKGVLLLTLGNLYWDMERFSDAGRCYGQAIGLLDKDRKDYVELSERSRKLDMLVPFTEAVHLQDSLQQLAKMPEKERIAAIDRVIEQLKKKEKEERDKQLEANAQMVQSKNGAQPSTLNSQPSTLNSSGAWYFYNPQAVAQGKQSFQRLWGKRENSDHWQRNNKTVVSFDSDTEQTDSISGDEGDNNQSSDIAEENTATSDTLANDPHNREYYLAQIPFTDEQVEASNAILSDALYNSGVIFKDQLDNLHNSERALVRLEKDFPTFEQMPDVWYHMFLLYSRLGKHDVAANYVSKLQESYPDHKWTILLSDPNYAVNQRFGVHIEDSLYASAYTAFLDNRTDEVLANRRISDDRFPLGANRDRFVFIGGLSRLNSGDVDGCLDDMNTLVKDYPQSRVAEIAGMIINGVKKGRSLHGGSFNMGDVWSLRTEVLNGDSPDSTRQFSAERNVEHLFLVAYQPDSVNENHLLYELARYNFSSFLVRNFMLEIEDADPLHIMKVSGFANYEEALEYAQQFYRQQNIIERLGKARTYVISVENKEMLGRFFSYNDYDDFYSQNFSDFKLQGDYQRLQEQKDAQLQLSDDASVPVGMDLNPKPKVVEPVLPAGMQVTTPTTENPVVEEPAADNDDDDEYEFEIDF